MQMLYVQENKELHTYKSCAAAAREAMERAAVQAEAQGMLVASLCNELHAARDEADMSRRALVATKALAYRLGNTVRAKAAAARFLEVRCHELQAELQQARSAPSAAPASQAVTALQAADAHPMLQQPIPISRREDARGLPLAPAASPFQVPHIQLGLLLPSAAAYKRVMQLRQADMPSYLQAPAVSPPHPTLDRGQADAGRDAPPPSPSASDSITRPGQAGV